MASIEFAETLKPLFQMGKWDFKVMHGGRGGYKSWGAARALLAMASQKHLRILCARELQGSIKDSVHALLKDQIELMGLGSLWTVGNDKIQNTQTGSYFIFEGLKNNIASVKGKERINICWVEEAENVSEESWEYLIPTIQRVPDSEIWVTFNPKDELDATYQMFITNPRENSWVIQTNYLQNKWLPQKFLDAAKQMKRENYKRYLHVYMGEPNANFEDSIIQPEWIKSAIDAHVKMKWNPRGVRVVGYDPADTGDNKATCRRHGFLVESMKDWSNGEIEEGIDQAFDEAFQSHSDCLVYDADGLGAAVKVGLDQRIKGKSLQVSPYRGGSSVDDPEDPYPPIDYSVDKNYDYQKEQNNKNTFRNKRAQYATFLADRFRKTHLAVQNNTWCDPEEMISISSDIPKKYLDQFRKEATRVQRKRGQNSFIQLESKADMKKRGMKSPNLFDAVVMSFANPPPFKQSSDDFYQTEWS